MEYTSAIEKLEHEFMGVNSTQRSNLLQWRPAYKIKENLRLAKRMVVILEKIEVETKK